MSRAIPLAEVFREAFAHEAAGRDAEALALYGSILAAVPDHPGALLRIAEIDLRRGDRALARTRLARAIESARAMGLPSADVLTALARVERMDGDHAKAQDALERALLDTPVHPGAMIERGVVAFESGDLQAAERAFRDACTRHPDLAMAWLQLALVLERKADLAAARDALARAVGARNAPPAAWEHAARVAWRTGDLVAAQALCDDGLRRHPDDPGILHQEGIVAKLTGRIDAACSLLLRALARAPRDPGLHLTLGGVLLDARRAGEALQYLERAIALGADSGEVWDNLGLARLACGDGEGAQQAFAEAVARSPALTPALANLVHLRQQHCAWDGLPELERRLVATLDDAASDARWPPFVALAIDLSSQEQVDVARRWSRAMLPVAVPAMRARPRASRLRIAYLGNDFREHAMGRLMAGLFEAHDRDAFEVFAYSYARDDASALQRRIRAAFEHWRELPEASDDDIARRIRADGIDVLIECKGHTRGGRLGIVASRPAPVQLHYMGFPGSLGYDAIDGIIADSDVVPDGAERHFHERVHRLPRCYFVNDSRREVPLADARSKHGLPDDALVLACFNQPYKITRPMLAIWVRALRAAPEAVLWLLATSDVQQRNLRHEVARAGMDPRRVVFAPPLAQEAHMARVGCADLALDTLPVNQHTTACDALWAGVPMLTVRGRTFAGRVGASLLRAAELDALITDSPDAYEAHLLDLVRDPAPLATYRAHLERRRYALPLFDTAGFARDWEALLVRAHEQALAASR